ncbi:DnaT-like ssDNA-binding domain-containing protein [Pantoea agglomerans]|uniref:DnaT-like ssDNA-binding domain-containing protein n=1 Tax=Enterobacter agglomerans TaxID=549 RepID=UPI003C7D7C05
MARIRTIKPEFWTDEDMSELSEPACLLAIGLLNYADDEGYFNANPKLIRAAVFPIREPSLSIPVLIQELSNCGYIAMYSTSDNKHFGHICNFSRHQVVNKPRPSKIKCLELVPYDYSSTTAELPLGMDQGSGIREMEETPHSAREEKLVAPVDNFPAVESAVINTPATGGKFSMFEDWLPDEDLQRRAAVWGIILKTPPEKTEIAEFVTYWIGEGKFFTQSQWEQKLARSVSQRRARPAASSATANRQRDITVMPVPDKEIPDGWRG